jgi:Skp family chaperone for outer membrane proteins
LKTSGDSILDPSLTRVSQEQETLAGTRKLPLQQELVDTMNYAAQKISEETGRNIYFKTFSGGQAPLGSGGPRTGSTEHDLGGAADNYFIEVLPDGTEKMLNMSNPDDKALMYKTAYHFARAGGRSVGLESGYMGNESIHLGISRNNEDPTHHADDELSAIVDQGKLEFLQEAKEKGWDPKYGYKDFYLQEKQRRQQEADAKLTAEAEAIAQADPVSATQNLIENNPAAANSAPAMATGGLMDVPPGENVEIRNRDTKEILAYANDRENIRVEPGKLEGSQQAPMITQEDTQRLEVPMQQQQVNLPRPPVPDTTDMSFAPIMMADTHYTPSSYERATLSATLRPQKNIHFAPSKHT